MVLIHVEWAENEFKPTQFSDRLWFFVLKPEKFLSAVESWNWYAGNESRSQVKAHAFWTEVIKL